MSGPTLSGVFIPHVTPLTKSGKVDTESLTSLIDYFSKVEGLGGLVSCARVGEGPVLDWEEQLTVYDVVAEAKPDDLPLVATVGAGSTAEAIEKIAQLKGTGVDAVMVIPPLLFAWGHAEPEMRYEFFADLNDATDVPLVLFQIPISSYWYDVETVSRISHLDNVVAIKEASFNVELFTDVVQTVQNDGGKISILSGNDRFLAQSLMLGIDGALVGVANVAPDQWVEMFAFARDQQFGDALRQQERLLEIKELTFQEPIVEAPARLKYCLREQGVIEYDTVRRPQRGIDMDMKQRLRTELEDRSLLQPLPESKTIE